MMSLWNRVQAYRGRTTSSRPLEMAARSNRLRISAVSSAGDPLFRRAFTLYSAAFPPGERIGREYFRNLFEESRLGLLAPFNFHFLVAHEGERVLGFISGTYLAIANLGFVGYLAVRPSAAGRQVGSRLRHRLIQSVKRDAIAAGHSGLRGMMGEVEHGNPWLERMRRRGALALDLDYFQPSTDGTAVVPLVLYFQPASERRVRSLSASALRQVLYAIYRRLYRIRFPLKQPEFRRMLRQIQGRSRVGGRPLTCPAKPRAARAKKIAKGILRVE
ncbi:MAG: GNAT family N-acetyltransferase [Vicinamibacteria bacterium]|nr:GNAT family N-acetyltransferase [Vicinamibacteria bacterium]